MQIEHIGFYETRAGDLAYALARMPDGTKTENPWVVCHSNGGVDCYTDGGLYYLNGRKDPSDLIRYLPTVKSWDDPIPPPEPPAVTVYTEWLVKWPDGSIGVEWLYGEEEPCLAVAKLRTVEVPANG